jgi:Uma2 family endonuclease
MTEEEYLALPETKPYLEFVDGEVIEKCMGDNYHSAIEFLLSGVFYEFWKRLKRGHFRTESRSRYARADGADHRVPDIAYYAAGKALHDPSGRGMAPPSLAIEIRSEGESAASQRQKCRWYLARGVAECWLIDPYKRTVEVFDADRDGVLLTPRTALRTAILPGFELPLEDLWAILEETQPD